ncbi:serine hydrolase domain-containing protein [Aureibacter tunicatorum]|uniref:CubicO group peptidase (Beta-lactamase class C family) n=1 Tax=Aureibacter tunicatorum TaxID=866807 RepID=A0AAE3XRS1_9BACT|nr:serine hydrolase [Aureibacter tunicatorum]MDR6240750.1 CubicO group peptidase (beta-lactamase class C family) [Aureibacter tunicatorum]BDD06917.1 serine hydrolase [Aureibacter tunicatorum]
MKYILKISIVAVFFLFSCSENEDASSPPSPPSPEQARINLTSAFQAKNFASGVFVSKRSKGDIIRQDFKAFQSLENSYNVDAGMGEANVRTSLGNLTANRSAIFREGLGCTLLNVDDAGDLRMQFSPQLYTRQVDNENYWPEGDKIYDQPIKGIDVMKLNNVLDEAFVGGERHAVAVVYDGQLIAEKYAEGISKHTKLLAWSMTKSLEGMILGVMSKEGLINSGEQCGFEEWKNDDRKYITVENLGRMTSGLEWNEGYGGLSDITAMLYEKNDMAQYAIDKKLKTTVGNVFNYSSGNAMILSSYIRSKFATPAEYLEYAQQKICEPLNIEALFEVDPAENMVLSSYGWLCARDLLRIGSVYMNSGVYLGTRILTEDWVEFSKKPTNVLPDPDYGFLFYLNRNQQVYKSAPADLFYFSGYNGQKLLMIPSKKLMVCQFGVIPEQFADAETDAFLEKILSCID